MVCEAEPRASQKTTRNTFEPDMFLQFALEIGQDIRSTVERIWHIYSGYAVPGTTYPEAVELFPLPVAEQRANGAKFNVVCTVAIFDCTRFTSGDLRLCRNAGVMTEYLVRNADPQVSSSLLLSSPEMSDTQSL